LYHLRPDPIISGPDQPCHGAAEEQNIRNTTTRKELPVPKFYVESGPVRLIFDAVNAQQAAVMTFQWTCDKQVEIEATAVVPEE
jgi:hypothetical protein